MLLLGLDTATFTASAALVDGAGAVLAEGVLDTSTRGDDLLVRLDELCRRAGITPRQLTAIAVGAGPGSFTGLRIGMATAKGIAFAAGAPLWLVSSLAAMAAEAGALAVQRDHAGPPGASQPAANPLLVPVLDARRGEVFVGFYRQAQEQELELVLPERVLPPAQLAEAVAAAVAASGGLTPVFSGDALAVHPALAPLADAWLAGARTPSGAWIARLARLGQRRDALRDGRPAYLRPAEAEVMYPDGVPGARRTVPLPDEPPTTSDA